MKSPRYTYKSVEWSFWKSLAWLVKHREWKRIDIVYAMIPPGDPRYDDAPFECEHIFHPAVHPYSKDGL